MQIRKRMRIRKRRKYHTSEEYEMARSTTTYPDLPPGVVLIPNLSRIIGALGDLWPDDEIDGSGYSRGFWH